MNLTGALPIECGMIVKGPNAGKLVQCRRAATYVGVDGRRVISALGPDDNRPNAICRECYENAVSAYPQLAAVWRSATGES